MSTPSFPQVPGSVTTEELADIVAKFMKEALWLLTGNLDVANIKAKSITADRMSVKELSAITADLGHITAGLIETVTMIASTIIGSLIKTADTGQRIELSSTENLLKAINNIGNTIIMKSNVGTTPDIEFEAAVGDFVRMYLLPGVFSMDTTTTLTDITLASGKGINLYPAGGYKVKVPSWDSLFSNSAGGGSGQTLQQALNDLSGSISSLSSWVSSLDARVSALESAPPPPGP